MAAPEHPLTRSSWTATAPEVDRGAVEFGCDTEFSCDTESHPGPGGRMVTIRVVGEIDLLTYPRLQLVLDAALFGTVDQPTGHLVIDLSGVTFCSARGLALLADTAQAAAAAAIDYHLAGCPPQVIRHWPLHAPPDPNPDPLSAGGRRLEPLVLALPL